MGDPFTGGDHEKWDAEKVYTMEDFRRWRAEREIPDIAGRDIRTQTSDPGCEED